MSKDGNEADYFGFPPYPVLNEGFGLTVIGFLVRFDLFYQIRDGFGTSSGIVTPARPTLP